ncbi:MAG: efflux transporter outer membrane subunit [Verrucomicrobiota bacterium]|nr:efflux transporter outer membrane subunit [Verrucomicrobiota bacterium]
MLLSSVRFLPTLVLCLLIFITTGCAVGPNYQRPLVETQAEWKWKVAEPRDAQSKGPWWELFNDVALNELEEKAVKNNQDLKAAFSRFEQARARARVKASDFWPRIDATPSATRRHTSGTVDSGGAPFPMMEHTANDFSVPFDLSYEIDVWGKIRRGFEASRNQMLASGSAYENVMFSLQSEVARNYFSLRTTDREIVILSRAVELRTQASDLFKMRMEAGVGSDLEVASVQTELANAAAELSAAKRRRAEFESTLAVLCGQTPGSFHVEPAQANFTPPQIQPGLPSALLERRPDVAEAERIMAARNAEIGVAKASAFPSIRLTGQAGFQSAELQDLFSWESKIWSLGPSISIPLFAGGRNSAASKSAQAAYDESVAQYRQRVLVAFKDVEDALAGLKFLDEQVQHRTQAVEASTKSANLSAVRFKGGIVNYLDVIDSERSRLNSEIALARTDLDRMSTTIVLIKAIGGGWVPQGEVKK